MRPLRRYAAGTALCLAGIALLLIGTGASFAYLAPDAEPPAPAAARESREEGRGIEVTLDVGLATPVAPVEPVTAHVEPPVVSEAALPGFSVVRDVRVEQAGVAVDAALDLAAGSHRAKTTAAVGEVATSSARAFVATPGAPAMAVAAAAFTLAGALAYFWGTLKAWATRGLALPLVGLYAKISRAEVFDNSVRERIFAAIRDNPGLSASDLARLANVSWGTTIYHLEVLEQTRMVSSLRKGRYRRYFENGAALATSKDAVAILRNPVTARVVDMLRARPGVTQKELAGATGMSPQALHWHLARLVETGLVRKEREGRVVRHFIAASAN